MVWDLTPFCGVCIGDLGRFVRMSVMIMLLEMGQAEESQKVE
jgi:hypothetical protein